MSYSNLRMAAIGMLAAMTVSGTALAADYDGYVRLPEVQQSGDITFITGGIGDEERAALEAVKSEYNLHLMSAHTSGSFEGDTLLTIYDNGNNEILSAHIGPIFYAKLPAGSYMLVATNGDQMRKQRVSVGANKSANAMFSWKVTEYN